MDIPNNDESSNKANYISSLNEEKECPNGKSDSRTDNLKDEDSVKPNEIDNHKSEDYIRNRKEEINEVSARDNVSIQNNNNVLKEKTNSENVVGADGQDNCKRDGINKNDHLQNEGVSSHKTEIYELVNNNNVIPNTTLKMDNDDHQTSNIGTEETENIDNLHNIKNVRSTPANNNTVNEIESFQPVLQESTKIKATETEVDDNQMLNESLLVCPNTNCFEGDNLDNKSLSSENHSKDLIEDSHELQNLSKHAGEVESENMSNNFEMENFVSSDTSALMKLAEIACKTNDTVASAETESINSHETDSCYSKLNKGNADINDTQNSKNFHSLDSSALKVNSETPLQVKDIVSANIFQEIDNNPCEDRNEEVPVNNNNNNNTIVKQNDCISQIVEGDGTLKIGSESETEPFISENIEGNANLPVSEIECMKSVEKVDNTKSHNNCVIPNSICETQMCVSKSQSIENPFISVSNDTIVTSKEKTLKNDNSQSENGTKIDGNSKYSSVKDSDKVNEIEADLFERESGKISPFNNNSQSESGTKIDGISKSASVEDVFERESGKVSPFNNNSQSESGTKTDEISKSASVEDVFERESGKVSPFNNNSQSESGTKTDEISKSASVEDVFERESGKVSPFNNNSQSENGTKIDGISKSTSVEDVFERESGKVSPFNNNSQSESGTKIDGISKSASVEDVYERESGKVSPFNNNSQSENGNKIDGISKSASVEEVSKIQANLCEQENGKVSPFKSHNEEREQQQKISNGQNSNNENSKNINCVDMSEDSVVYHEENTKEAIISKTKENATCAELLETSGSKEVNINNDVCEHSSPLHKGDNFLINEEPISKAKIALSSVELDATLEKPGIVTDKNIMVTYDHHAEKDVTDPCQQDNSGNRSETKKSNFYPEKETSHSEKGKCSLLIENNEQHSPVVEKNSEDSGMESNLDAKITENCSQNQNILQSTTPSKLDSSLSVMESSTCSVTRSNSLSCEVENISCSLQKENNLPPSVRKCDSHPSLTNKIERVITHSVDVKNDSHLQINKSILHSLLEENNLNSSIQRQTQIVLGSSSSPKIYIRKDLHEGFNCEGETLKNSSNDENSTSEDVHQSSVRLKENRNKRALPDVDKTDENCVKRTNYVLNVISSEESSDEDKLIIDEENTNLKYVRKVPKDKNNKGQDYKYRNKGPDINSESNIKIKNPNSIIQCNTNDKIDESTTVSTTSNLKPAVEVVDLVDGDEPNEDLIKKTAKSLNNDKNFICEKCKDIWNDEVLKLLFEGNESVTVNSRITYGAIICMNIYVSIHYPKIKEQALIGLLDRADLAKNLGSIQVSLLNSWLVALIKNKRISCCDPFRPVYRAKAPGQVHTHDNIKVGNKDFTNHNQKAGEKISMEPSKKERYIRSAACNQSCSPTEIVIDDENDHNQDQDERNVQNMNSDISLISGKDIMKIGSGVKTGSTIPDLKSGVLTNGKAFTKQFAKYNPVSYSIIQRERESLSNDLHDAYDKLVYESKLTEEEAKNGRRKILTNKEILCIHSIFILNAKEILLEKYYRFLFQLLYYRGNILLIPDGKSLVQKVENIRKEHNRMKFSVAKNKAFLAQSWDIDNIYTSLFTKPANKRNDYSVKVVDILSVFCSWKNKKILNLGSDMSVLREEILKLYENKIEISDCFGLCIKLYANYCRLLFSQNESENMKTKVFLNLLYLPNNYLSSIENTLIFDSEITHFPMANRNSDIIDYLEKQTKKGNGQVKRSYLDSVIDAKLQQAKRLKTDLLNSVKTPKATALIESYAKLKNELNYLEIEPTNHSFKSPEDSQEENLIKASTYTPEVKLIVAKLRASNIDSEYIPVILEKIFHNIFKRKIPTL